MWSNGSDKCFASSGLASLNRTGKIRACVKEREKGTFINTVEIQIQLRLEYQTLEYRTHWNTERFEF